MAKRIYDNKIAVQAKGFVNEKESAGKKPEDKKVKPEKVVKIEDAKKEAEEDIPRKETPEMAVEWPDTAKVNLMIGMPNRKKHRKSCTYYIEDRLSELIKTGAEKNNVSVSAYLEYILNQVFSE